MNIDNEARVLSALFSGETNDLPADFEAIDPHSQRASILLRAVGREALERGGEALAANGGSSAGRDAAVALLLLAAYEACKSKDQDYIQKVIALLRKIYPKLGFDLSLIWGLNYAAQHTLVVTILEPHVGELICNPQRYGGFMALLTDSAYELRRFDLVKRVDVGQHPTGAAAREAAQARRRVAAMGSADLIPSLSPQKQGLIGALQRAAVALDEVTILTELSQADAEALGVETDDDARSIVRLALALAGICREECWARPYRQALSIASVRLSRHDAITEARDQWALSKLPPYGFESFLIMTGTRRSDMGEAPEWIQQQPEWRFARRIADVEVGADVEASYLAAVNDFHAAPGLAAAKRVWRLAYLSGRFIETVRASLIDAPMSSAPERARSLLTTPLPDGPMAPLWVMMTWLSGPDRLLQTLGGYAGKATIVVSIGGDAHPPGIARASAALLCRDLHLFARPVVTWGGQRGMFHNLMAIWEAFRTRSGPDGWLQTVCDRSYPILSIGRLRLNFSASNPNPNGCGHIVWRNEFIDDVAHNLPVRYADALDEIFGACQSTRFVELATRSPAFGDNDVRLGGSTFNFSREALRVWWDTRGAGWHDYRVSPFEADMRWMSFARLQEFVDVATETRQTFARRLPPAVARWVHRVLMKYDLRTGDPWVMVNRRYIDRVLSDPDFDELVAAMNLGFAPEMNFLDTVAATFGLQDDFIHHHHPIPAELAADGFLYETCVAADRSGKAFVRRTDPITGRELLKFFVGRTFEDDSARGLHWVAASGPFADDDSDPRPSIDEGLLDPFYGVRVTIRDLLYRRVQQGVFHQKWIAGDDGSTLADWRFVEGGLEVSYVDPSLGVKRYERTGADGQAVTFAPSELVSAHNDWSAFLEFSLSELRPELGAHRLRVGHIMDLLSAPSVWIGAGQPETALLAAFADHTRSDFPTPTVSAHGGVYEIRGVEGVDIALCALGGFPVLLQLAGSAKMGDRFAVHLAPATTRQAELWAEAAPSAPVESLNKTELIGRWRFQVLNGSFEGVLDDDWWIYDELRSPIGRWFLRDEGLQVLGLRLIRLGLANLVRRDFGALRLCGWAWLNVREAGSFSMERIEACD